MYVPIKRSMHHRVFLKFVGIVLLLIGFHHVHCQDPSRTEATPDTVKFSSGNLTLGGLLWKPSGPGPHPAVLYNHGSEAKPEQYLSSITPAFLAEGYAFFVPFRRGQGFSKGQGKYIAEALDSAGNAGGGESRFNLMIALHETTQLQDQLAALAFLKRQPGIDS